MSLLRGFKEEVIDAPKRLSKPNLGVKPEDHSKNTLENIPKNYGNGTGFTQWFPKFLKKQGANQYPEAYNPYIHGPYYPSRYYGKADTAFMDLKLGEIPAWIGRREKSFKSSLALYNRGVWRWVTGNLNAKRPGFAPMWQIIIFSQLLFIINQWGKHRNLAHSKYH